MTGFKKGAFSVTVDTRLDNEIDIPLVEWFEGKYDGNFVGLCLRSPVVCTVGCGKGLELGLWLGLVIDSCELRL